MQTIYFVKSRSLSQEREWDEGGVQQGFSDLQFCIQTARGKIKSYGDASSLYSEITAAAALCAAYSAICQFSPFSHLSPISAPKFIVND